MKSLAALRRSVEELCCECGILAQQIRDGHQREFKDDGSIVTEADKRIESLLRIRLPELVSGSTVWGEEEGYRTPGEGGLWLVDPVDGTSNYSYGSPLWGISVGFYRDKEIQLGVVRLPDMDQTLSAAKGEGATLNGKPLAPLRKGEILPSELVSYDDGISRLFPEGLPGKMRYAGAFVAEAAFMAQGIFRGLLSSKADFYDIAASTCILRELGAELTYVRGGRIDSQQVVEAGELRGAFKIFPPGVTNSF